MKAILYICFFFTLSGLLCSQTKDSTSQKEVYTIVEKAAEFPGGTGAMMKYIQSNVKYPEKAREICMAGKVFIKFIVDDFGKVVNPEIIKSSGFSLLDSEAVRVVRIMPQWTPAALSGRNVKCYFNLPIGFYLDAPYLLFNSENKNEKYVLAKEAIDRYNIDAALKLYQEDTGDVDAWFNMAVIYYIKGNKNDSKKYFENVKLNSPTESKNYTLSDKFLKNNF